MKLIYHRRQGVSIGVATARRGAGFGNEAIPWAKAYIGARVLGLDLARPRWISSRYDLPRALGWNRVAMVRERLGQLTLPRIRLTEADFRSTGCADYADGVRALRDGGFFPTAGPFMVEHEGMWGGYLAVRSARNFLRAQVWSAPGVAEFLDERVRELSDRPEVLRVGVHVRRGDFDAQPPSRGGFNGAIPMDWYLSLMGTIRSRTDGAVQFVVCSDAPARELRPLLDRDDVVLARGSGPAAMLQELALLSAQDLMACSVSSFSMLAAFLSERPYVWYRPQLTEVDGFLSLWGREPAQASPDSPTFKSVAACSSDTAQHTARGAAWEEGRTLNLPLLELTSLARSSRDENRDLIYYGVVDNPEVPLQDGGLT